MTNLTVQNDKSSFDAFVKANESKLIVVDFFATWCPPCKMIAPYFEELAKQNPDVEFVKIDVDQNSETSEQYGIRAMPTFKFIKGGKVVDEVTGASKEKIAEKVAALK